MKEGNSSFTDVLNEYVGRSAYRPGQLARLTGVPQMTIVNWLQGRVLRPRVWQDVVRLGQVLRLDLPEMNEVLAAAGYPSVNELRRLAQDDEDRCLFNFWVETRLQPVRPSPFSNCP